MPSSEGPILLTNHVKYFCQWVVVRLELRTYYDLTPYLSELLPFKHLKCCEGILFVQVLNDVPT